MKKISQYKVSKILDIFKLLVKFLIKLIGILLSKLLYFILFLNKLVIVIIREDRIGHQIGTLDCELFNATERKKKYNIIIII